MKIVDKLSDLGFLKEPKLWQKAVVFSGAGLSAESGIDTFRDKGGLWEKHSIEEVATPEAWQRNRQRVLEFYNMRRRQLLKVQPNRAHQLIAKLQVEKNLNIITQNVDDLLERAGAKQVLHLHGELRKSRSSLDESLVYPIDGWELKMGMKCEKGSQLRPHVVWFGKMVPAMEEAQRMVKDCSLMIVVGTSLQVYPAAGLIHDLDPETPLLVIDPEPPSLPHSEARLLPFGAVRGLEMLVEALNN
jgi:NAD-dependent deacetylase